jgi:hypothetical protein
MVCGITLYVAIICEKRSGRIRLTGPAATDLFEVTLHRRHRLTGAPPPGTPDGNNPQVCLSEWLRPRDDLAVSPFCRQCRGEGAHNKYQSGRHSEPCEKRTEDRDADYGNSHLISWLRSSRLTMARNADYRLHVSNHTLDSRNRSCETVLGSAIDTRRSLRLND